MKRRIVMTLFGVLVGGFSVGMFNLSAFGMDPYQVFAHGIANKLTFAGYGTIYMILTFLFLIAVWFLDKKKIGIATFINIFLLGYVVEFSSWLWASLFPNPSILVRSIFLILALIIMCFASALYFTADLGVSTYDAIALSLSEQHGWDFRFVRITTDLICTAIGFFLGAVVGIGTLITALFMGPLIEFFNRTVARPLRYGKKQN
ncbi:MAG: DUF6198 family protein [Eubacteriales bacterium]|nr:DUF6198 family protein [Eubacteriales bacterium]